MAQVHVLPGIEWIRESQLAHRDDKPLWVTEFGWTTDTSSRWGVTEDQQAQYLAGAFAMLHGLTYVRAAVAYELRNSGEDPAELEHNFGLLRRDFSEKPAYAAVREAFGGALASSPMDLAQGDGAHGDRPTDEPDAKDRQPQVPGDGTTAASVARTSAARQPRHERVTVSGRVVGRHLLAVGHAPRGRQVRIFAISRGHARLGGVIRRIARADARGRFECRIGPRRLRATLRASVMPR